MSSFEDTPLLSSPLAGSRHALSRHMSSPVLRHQEIEARIASALEVVEIINAQEKRNFRLGVVLIVVAVASWITGLELVNSVLKGDEYTKPFLLSVVTGLCFSLNLLPEVVGYFRKLEPETTPLPSNQRIEKLQAKIEGDLPEELTPREITVLSLQIAFIYYLYNVLGMLSLRFTSASNQTVLGSTTAIFTLFIGVLLKIDKFTTKKLLCVIISMAGVILINVSQSPPTDDHNKYQPKNPKLGNTLALAAAFCYALYLIIMKVKCGTGTKTTNERRLFGYVGLVTALFGVPVLFLVHILDIEKFEFPPPNNTILVMVLVNSVFSYISDFVTILAMLLTSPLITSLALTSAIPISVFIDFVIMYVTNTKSLSSNVYMYGFGIFSILMSVILINVNIFNENEYIEEIIEGALEDAIRHDEVLLPLLSPLLDSAKHSPHVEALSIGFNRSPFARQPTLQKRVSGFDLNLDLVPSISQVTEHSQEVLVYGGHNHQYRLVHVDDEDD